MSKITNDGLTRSGTGCFIAVGPYPYGNSGRQRVKKCTVICDRVQVNLSVGPNYGACDTALHVNPRYDQNNVIVRNSFINGAWGAEERGGSAFHVPKGQQLECMLLIEHDVIKVRIQIHLIRTQ